eukprot:gene13786-15229_t
MREAACLCGFMLLYVAVHGLDTAMIDVVLVENNAGKYTTLTYHVKGRFSRAGAVTSAEGDIVQSWNISEYPKSKFNVCASKTPLDKANIV